MRLTSRFGRFSPVLRSDCPLTDEQIFSVVPSIFAEEKHDSRSDRYTYIPTGTILTGLRKEGFQPFYVCQTRVRDESQRDHTKHMIRLRHADQVNDKEANEIILINSHNGSSSYQMMAGMYRFVCSNGMVCGETYNDIRIPHKGDVAGLVIDGAYRVLDSFEEISEQRNNMRALTLNRGEQMALARSALMLRFDEEVESLPVKEEQILMPRRSEDRKDDLWSTYNVLQENLIKGGLYGRRANGKRMTTRAISGIDQNVKLNRALWTLTEAMMKLKG